MDSLKDILLDIKAFFYGGIRNLPFSIAGTFLLIGLGTANYAILFFLLGYLLLTPCFTNLFNFFGNLLPSDMLDPYKSQLTDNCHVISSSSTFYNKNKEPESVLFNPWTTMIASFFGYIINNAFHLYTRDGESDSITVGYSSYDGKNPDDNKKPTPNKVNKTSQRKNQSIMAIISILFSLIIVIVYRLYSECEKWISLIFGTVFFFFFGFTWYYLLSLVGQDRLSDLFGIANRLLPPSAIRNDPVACIPIF